MPNVVARIKIFPESVEEYERVKKKVEEEIKPIKVGEEEIGYGLKAVIITVLLEDEKGSEGIEERINRIEGVSRAQIEAVSRV